MQFGGFFNHTIGGIFGVMDSLNNSTTGDITFEMRVVDNDTNLTEVLRITHEGHVLPGANNTYDLGSSSYRFANVYAGDLHLKNEKGDWTVEEGEDDLFITNNKTGKKFKFKLEEVT
jgi:hypothetical protein